MNEYLLDENEKFILVDARKNTKAHFWKLKGSEDLDYCESFCGYYQFVYFGCLEQAKNIPLCKTCEKVANRKNNIPWEIKRYCFNCKEVTRFLYCDNCGKYFCGRHSEKYEEYDGWGKMFSYEVHKLCS